MEDFVSFEVAKKLKEKGFPQRPDYFNYSSYYDWDGLRKIHSLSNASVWFDPNISRDNIYFAPTISQVLKWLREEKEIDIILQPIFLYNENNREREYGIEIYAPQLNKPTHLDYFKNWEKGAVAGIEYVLDNLI
jgi:hypothetical protein